MHTFLQKKIIFFVSRPISHRRTMSRKVCFIAVFAVFALLQVCLLLCLRLTSILELIFSQIPPHTHKVLRSGPLLCTKILHKKMRPFWAEFFCFKMFTHKSGPEPVPYMCVHKFDLKLSEALCRLCSKRVGSNVHKFE